MIQFVLFALLSHTLNGQSSLVCPSRTTQVGGLNSDIAGCGLEGCNARYQDHYQSIDDCRDGCFSRTDCKSFTWASLNGDKNHPGKTVCTLYDSDIPNQRWAPDQIMCKPFTPPISTTSLPITTAMTTTSGDMICNATQPCTIICDELDPIRGCSNSIINAKHASSLHVICSSSNNDFYGGCEFSTIWCPLTNQCTIECIDYYACYLLKIYASYDQHNFIPLLTIGKASTTLYFKEIGPYKDASTRALRYGPHDWTYTAETCQKACAEYKYFALEARGWCSCDNDWSHVTMYGSARCAKTGGDWCNYVYENMEYNQSQMDVGQKAFNDAFKASGTFIIRRDCPQCITSHQLVYYKRITNPLSFDAYTHMKVWTSTNNELGTDFNLYNSLEDALDDVNAWTYCNYDDPNVAAFRDCGALQRVHHQLCSVDAYGGKQCLFSVYVPQHSSNNNTVNITCAAVDGSCLKTRLYANESTNVSVSCYGSGLLSSRLHSACDDFAIHAELVSQNVYLWCLGDYSCYKMNLFADNANGVHAYARGRYALSSSYVHAKYASALDVFCGSELSEYGCYKLYVFNPNYASHDDIRTRIRCQGHGCYDELYFLSTNGGFDVDIELNGCYECDDPSSCINQLSFYCGDELSLHDMLRGDECNSTDCHCDYALNSIKSNWVDNYAQCEIFGTDYVCEDGKECVIDCMEEWPNSNGCYDKVISAENASSLTMICDSISNLPLYGACESSHIYCPMGHDAPCEIQCMNRDACYDLEITGARLNLTCIDSDSCCHTNVYGASNGGEMNVTCIATDACLDINVTANNADTVRIWCEGDTMHSSYAACSQFNVYSSSSANDILLTCEGDSSCHDVDIFAEFANNIVVNVLGDYAGYDGDIYGMNAQHMSITCKSGYGYYGCYNMRFYIPQSTDIECVGNGCNGLEVYAANGFADIASMSVDSCGECALDECLASFTMYCGTMFGTQSGWNEAGICDNELEYALNDTQSLPICDVFQSVPLNPLCAAAADDKHCSIDCDASDTQCSRTVISAPLNASSLTVHCEASACYKSLIYCPISSSSCTIICNGSQACDYMKIHAEDDSVLNVECGALSCEYAEIHIENALEGKIKCSGSEACSSLSVFGDDADHIDIQCVGNYSAEYSSPCNSVAIHARNAQSLNVSCLGTYSCADATVDAHNAQQVRFDGIGRHSIYRGWMDAQNASLLSLNFVSHHRAGVKHIQVDLPPSNTHLNCVGFGCSNIHFSAQSGGMNVIEYISFSGDGQCISPETCIKQWKLKCGDGSSATLTGSSCTEDSCDCNTLQSRLEEAYASNTNNENEITADRRCEEGTDCVIHCDKCVDWVISGDGARSMEVRCDGAYACEYVIVYCPESMHSSCNIVCEGHASCYSLEVHGNANNAIELRCASTQACANGNIYASQATQINVHCHGYDDCISTDSPCFNLKVHASFVTNQVTLECKYESACCHAILYAENANQVEVTGDDGYGAMEYALIYAQNASSFALTCIASTSAHGCYYANVYVPPKENTTLNCYGFGCSYLFLYVAEGMESLSASNIVLNSCANKICSSPSACISEWRIYCNDWKDNIGAFDTDITFYGDECSKYSYHCGCASYAADLLTNVFVNHSFAAEECEAILVANWHTTTTTDIIDSAETTQKDAIQYSKLLLIVVMTLCGLCVCCCFWMTIAVCVVRRRRWMSELQRMIGSAVNEEEEEVHDDEGDINVVDIAQIFPQPMDPQPIQTNDAATKSTKKSKKQKGDALLTNQFVGGDGGGDVTG
eukprot:228646_1